MTSLCLEAGGVDGPGEGDALVPDKGRQLLQLAVRERAEQVLERNSQTGLVPRRSL